MVLQPQLQWQRAEIQVWSVLSKDFILRLMWVFARKLNANYKFDRTSCDYHEHVDEDEKEQCLTETGWR